jgi:hypothetical protein
MSEDFRISQTTADFCTILPSPQSTLAHRFIARFESTFGADRFKSVQKCSKVGGRKMKETLEFSSETRIRLRRPATFGVLKRISHFGAKVIRVRKLLPYKQLTN